MTTFLVVRNWHGNLHYEKTIHPFNRKYGDSRVAIEIHRIRLRPEDEGLALDHLIALHVTGLLPSATDAATAPVAWYWTILGIPPTTNAEQVTVRFAELSGLCRPNSPKLKQIARAANAALASIGVEAPQPAATY